MKLSFTNYLPVYLKSDESEFIHWFREKVDSSDLSEDVIGATDKHLYGELINKTFWIKKKNKLFYKSEFKPPLLDFSLISGRYELKNNSLAIDLWVSLKSQIRNQLFVGIPIWTGIAVYVYIKYGDSSTAILPIGFGIFLLYLIWRVRQDAKFFSNYLKEEVEEVVCNIRQPSPYQNRDL